ncbi:MAG: precorrin-3B synthase [Pseudonocardia sp.]|nr:precorrin-3B synthase [Pseudonocardia sp.]
MPAAVRSRTDACPGVFAPHDAADGALARIRLPGGVIGATALRLVADCAEDLGDGRVHLTSRGNLQLRGLSRSGALAARLGGAGLLPSATHERVRNVLASPLAGIACGATDPPPRVSTVGPAADDPPFGTSTVEQAALHVPTGRSPDVRAMAATLDRGLCARPPLADLPGRFLFALDDGRGDVAAEDPDLCWQAPDRLLVAGVDNGLRVAEAQAVAALLHAAEAFLALRAADGGTAWRAAELVDAPARIAAALGRSLQEGHLHAATPQQGGSPATAQPAAARPGPVRRDDGGLALVVAPLLGELTADQVRLLATAGPAAVVTPWRTIVLPAPRVPAAGLAAAGLLVEPGPAADISACAGRPGCAKALADVRADALAALSRLPGGRVHVSGCARRCGAPRAAHVDAVALAGGRYLVDGVPRPGLVP